MKIAALQMVSTPSVERNLDAAAPARSPRRRARAPSCVVAARVLLHHGPKRPRQARGRRGAPATGRSSAMLAEAAREHGVWLVGGTLPLRSGEPSAGR